MIVKVTRSRFLGMARPENPPYLRPIFLVKMSVPFALLLLIYTNRSNQFLVLINIVNDTSLKQIGYNVDFPFFGQKLQVQKKGVAHNSKTEGRMTFKP